MIDLHLHLDGSLSEEDFLYLSKLHGISLGDDFPQNIYVPDDCPSLESYLERFDLPLKLLQTKESINYAVKSLVKRLYNAGFIYAEIRFAPLLHVQNGLPQMDVALAALKGLEDGLKECSGFDANLILCCMRHAEEDMNMATIEVANRLKGTKVVAVDLAGAEKLHPSSYYAKIFNRAKECGLNITIHAGEATGSDEIMMALDNGAMRIGHGVHLSLDEETVKRVKENNICFEFCPSSNLQTKSLKEYKDVPLIQFMELGIPVTINSDNMTVSHTDVTREFVHMMDTFNLEKDEVKKLLLNSIEYAFIDKKQKEKLKKELELKIDPFYEKITKR